MKKCALYLLLGITHFLALFPLKVHYFWADVIAWVLRSVVGYRREVIAINLARSFPEAGYDHLVWLSREVYYWDNAIGYNMAAEIAEGQVSPLWKSVYDSIINQSFNYLSALPSALFMRIFCTSHTVYILSLVNCFLL